MSYRDQLFRAPNGMEYRGYVIVEKRDFGGSGYLIDGFRVQHGYVVTEHGGCNAMPGATWFLSVREACEAIDVLLARGEKDFWNAMDLVRKAQDEALKRALAVPGKAALSGEVPLLRSVCEQLAGALRQAQAFIQKQWEALPDDATEEQEAPFEVFGPIIDALDAAKAVLPAVPEAGSGCVTAASRDAG